jgi:protein AroM
MKIGTVTIGQSPREDVIGEIVELLGADAQIIETGALDGLGRDAIRALEAAPGEPLLITRLRDGAEVRVAERHIHRLAAGCIAELERARVDVILLLCTGDFPEYRAAPPIVRPGRVLVHAARSLLEGGRLGVLVPAAEQVPAIRTRWASAGFEPIVEALSPYRASAEELRARARALAGAGAALIVLDCFGFTRAARALVREETGLPVLLPRTLAAAFARELAGA